MQSRHLLVVITLAALLALGSFAAWSQPPGSDASRPQASSPGQFMGPPPGVMCADGHNVYILHGPWLYQYSASDLTLKKKVQLPRPEMPEGQRPSEGQRPYGGQRPPEGQRPFGDQRP